MNYFTVKIILPEGETSLSQRDSEPILSEVFSAEGYQVSKRINWLKLREALETLKEAIKDA